ncbi:hypothetical protein FRB95_002508 [Tulasnella sp. JGI-2019a]|nr:hypothetical protein FRB93_004836 [Tulasnella sp. JGI-2019a]KAG9031579.1 hypothetical protein FRB95_002508 [Tulasnella sp. JGI-2019a]
MNTANTYAQQLPIAQISSPPTPLAANLPGYRLPAADKLELSNHSEHASKADQVIDLIIAALKGDFEEEIPDY